MSAQPDPPGTFVELYELLAEAEHQIHRCSVRYNIDAGDERQPGESRYNSVLRRLRQTMLRAADAATRSEGWNREILIGVYDQGNQILERIEDWVQRSTPSQRNVIDLLGYRNDLSELVNSEPQTVYTMTIDELIDHYSCRLPWPEYLTAYTPSVTVELPLPPPEPGTARDLLRYLLKEAQVCVNYLRGDGFDGELDDLDKDLPALLRTIDAAIEWASNREWDTVGRWCLASLRGIKAGIDDEVETRKARIEEAMRDSRLATTLGPSMPYVRLYDLDGSHLNDAFDLYLASGRWMQ